MTSHRACGACLWAVLWSGGTVGRLRGIPDVTLAALHKGICWERGGRAKKLERHDARHRTPVDTATLTACYYRHCDLVFFGHWDNVYACRRRACVTAPKDMRVLFA